MLCLVCSYLRNTKPCEKLHWLSLERICQLAQYFFYPGEQQQYVSMLLLSPAEIKHFFLLNLLNTHNSLVGQFHQLASNFAHSTTRLSLTEWFNTIPLLIFFWRKLQKQEVLYISTLVCLNYMKLRLLLPPELLRLCATFSPITTR